MRPAIELRHLYYFVAVAEELSFSRAAVRVGIAQPPLSQQIQKLEDIVGCTLFDRGGRRVRVTDAGATLLPLARRILADVAQATDVLHRASQGESGTVSIGYWPSTLFSPLPAAVRRFRERFPRVQVRLIELVAFEDMKALRAGSIDIAVVREPEPEAGIVAFPVLVEPFVAVVPADHALAGQRTVPLSALAGEPFVLFPPETAPGLHRKVLERCRGAGFEPRVVQEVEAWHTIVSLVEAGIGVSLIPASFEGRRAGELRYLALTGRQVYTTTMACVRASGQTPAAASFLEILGALAGPPKRAATRVSGR